MTPTTEVFTGLRGLFRLYDRMLKRVCTDHDLTVAEAEIVSFLLNNPEKDTAGDITELRMISKGAVSKLERLPDREDRRKIHLRLREQAKPLMEAVDQVREEFLAAVLKGFSSRDLATLVELQRRLFENSRNALEGRRSDPK